MYFYRDLFASLCFLFFGAALAFKYPYLFFLAMMCGCLSSTAKKKQWEDPVWARLYEENFYKWLDGKRQQLEFNDEDEINPLPPVGEDRSTLMR